MLVDIKEYQLPTEAEKPLGLRTSNYLSTTYFDPPPLPPPPHPPAGEAGSTTNGAEQGSRRALWLPYTTVE